MRAVHSASWKGRRNVQSVRIARIECAVGEGSSLAPGHHTRPAFAGTCERGSRICL